MTATARAPSTTHALSRTELDPMRCGEDGCECAGPLILSPVCHIGEPVRVSYDWTTGLLTATCAECRRFIVSILVAEARP